MSIPICTPGRLGSITKKFYVNTFKAITLVSVGSICLSTVFSPGSLGVVISVSITSVLVTFVSMTISALTKCEYQDVQQEDWLDKIRRNPVELKGGGAATIACFVKRVRVDIYK